MSQDAASIRQLCTFAVNGLLFGIDVVHVQEVIRYQEHDARAIGAESDQRAHQSARSDRNRARYAGTLGDACAGDSRVRSRTSLCGMVKAC